jgi:hypothetical protein
MFEVVRERRARAKRIAELKRLIAEAEAADYGFGDSEEEQHAESQAIDEKTRPCQNELDYLLQANLFRRVNRLGIDIPQDKLYTKSNWDEYSILTVEGEAWVRRELSKYRDSRIEFWAKIVLPIASLILSVIALMKRR